MTPINPDPIFLGLSWWLLHIASCVVQQQALTTMEMRMPNARPTKVQHTTLITLRTPWSIAAAPQDHGVLSVHIDVVVMFHTQGDNTGL